MINFTNEFYFKTQNVAYFQKKKKRIPKCFWKFEYDKISLLCKCRLDMIAHTVTQTINIHIWSVVTCQDQWSYQINLLLHYNQYNNLKK